MRTIKVAGNLIISRRPGLRSYKAGFFLTKPEESAQLTHPFDWYTLVAAVYQSSAGITGTYHAKP
jgi:hypothetical protein